MEFMEKVKYHEELLTGANRGNSSRDFDKAFDSWRSQRKKQKHQAKVNAVAAAKKPAHTPAFPKDDSNVSKKTTPKAKGARPCWHCGSLMHWDNECVHSSKNAKRARVHFASLAGDELEEQEAYEDLLANLSELSDSETESSSSEVDFQ